MTDIQTSDWSETAASNNAAAPNGWPEGMAFSAVNDSARETHAAVKREYNRAHATQASGGTGAAYTLTYTSAPAAYTQGAQFAFRAAADNSASATLNVSGLGAKTLKKPTSAGLADLAAGDIKNGQIVVVQYDSSADAMVMISPIANPSVPASISATAVYASNIGASTVSASHMYAVTLNVTGNLSATGATAYVSTLGAATASASHMYAVTLGVTSALSGTGAAAFISTIGATTVSATVLYPGTISNSKQVAKAAVRFYPSGTVVDQYNVASVTRNGTGDYTINFQTTLSSATYIPIITARKAAAVSGALGMVDDTVAPTSTACRIVFVNLGATATDPQEINFAVFGG